MCKSLLKSSGVRTLANVNILNIEVIAGAISAGASVLKDIDYITITLMYIIILKKCDISFFFVLNYITLFILAINLCQW